MSNTQQILPPELQAQALQRAFDTFNRVSSELTLAYEGLQARAESLTAELAVANGELRRQYQEKEALSERLSLLLNALPAGVVVLDNAARVSQLNPAAQAMFDGQVLERPWSALAQQYLLPTEAPGEWQLGAQRIAIAESPLDSAGGRILLLHDITVAHGLKTDLERSRHLAAMGEMAASLAHQLRTPLATALLYSANLAQPSLSDAARTRFAEKATAQLQRLERLIQDVLLFARGERIGRDVIDLQGLITQAAQTMAPLFQAQGIEFTVSVNVDGSIITGNAKALGGALLNLLENALQACIAHTQNAQDVAQVSLAAMIAGRTLRIMVRDSGGGIDSAVQARIFEPFFTTRGQGTGLGLAIALGVARAHGGAIDFVSTAGTGSEFILSLPVSIPRELRRQDKLPGKDPTATEQTVTKGKPHHEATHTVRREDKNDAPAH